MLTNGFSLMACPVIGDIAEMQRGEATLQKATGNQLPVATLVTGKVEECNTCCLFCECRWSGTDWVDIGCFALVLRLMLCCK
jgi:hypothetical protein